MTLEEALVIISTTLIPKAHCQIDIFQAWNKQSYDKMAGEWIKRYSYIKTLAGTVEIAIIEEVGIQVAN